MAETKKVFRNSLLTLLFSLLLFAVYDTVLFRSNLYSRIANPDGFDNTLFYAVQFEKDRKPTGKKDVLIVGNSKIENAFSIVDFNERFADAPIAIQRGSSPATEERAWFYTIAAVDPDRNKYAAVVIPLLSYKATTEGAGVDGARILGPILKLSDWPSFVNYIPAGDVRDRALNLALFRSHAYSLDFQDLILHPIKRLEALQNIYGKRQTWEYERYRIRRDGNGKIDFGGSNTLDGFNYDAASGKIMSMPPELHLDRIRYIEHFFQPVAPDLEKARAKENGDVRFDWLQRIVDYYAGSQTKVIFVQLPFGPFPLVTRRVLEGAPDFRTLVKNGDNAVFLDENAFKTLESVAYFQDPDHLNPVGRDFFTDRLGQLLIAQLRAP